MEDLMNCPVCMKPLDNQNRLITEACGHSKCRHCLITESNGCEECNKANRLPANHSKQTDSITDDPNSSCKNASEVRTRAHKIPSHIVKTLNDDNKVIFQCTVCDKRLKSRSQQYYHLYCNNSSNKPFKCNECNKYFATSGHLKYHMEGHTQQSFQCPICSKYFSRTQTLRKHEKLHKTTKEECQECGAKLRNKKALNAHLMRHKNILPFKCDECDKAFSLRTSLKLHQQTVHIVVKKFKCDRCGKHFNRNSSLKTHQSLHHSNRKEYNCLQCPRHFFDHKSLLRHNKIHNVKSKYKCTFCDTSSIRKDNILRHIRNMHPDEDKISCIDTITEENECSENESSSNENNTIGELENVPDVPKIVANSSVIRCIGNVKPVSIAKKDQSKAFETVVTCETSVDVPNNQEAKIHKKLKKPYDPRDIYRKILLDDDSTQDNDTSINNEEIPNAANDHQPKQIAQESSVICNGQQSNFSETHWRKNFKHNYQIQFD